MSRIKRHMTKGVPRFVGKSCIWSIPVFFASICSTVLAQESKPSADDSSPAARDASLVVQLVRDPMAQKELNLDKLQRAKITALVAEVEYPLFLLRDYPADQKQSERNALAEQVEAGLKTTLEQPQRQRLSELLLRAQGYPALVAPPYSEALKLSTSQVDGITKLLKSAREAKVGTPAANVEKQILATLSSEQSDTLAKLAGSPFDFTRVQQVACQAPELRDVERWINTEPLSFAKLKGRVVAVHFWAFGCINCVHNLPHYQDWHRDFADKGLTVLGIHTPETAAERSLDNLAQNVKTRDIQYPVAADMQGANWNAWANHLWPSVYLVDRRGQVRYWWYGELTWQGAHGDEVARKRIIELLAEKAVDAK